MKGSFIDLFDDHISEVRCIDIGAMINEEDEAVGHGKQMSILFQHPKVTVIGFEPQQDKCDDLNARYPNHRYLPHAVADGKTRTFHTTRTGLSSSFFPVDYSILEPLDYSLSSFDIVASTELETTRLDDVPDAMDCDFLKLDAEGAEVMILENARAALDSCTVAQLEVSFLPYRKDAPIFGDVDKAICESGFLIHKLGMMGANFMPWCVPNDPSAYISQIFAGDVMYTKDFRTFGEMSTDKLFRMAAVLHDIYRSLDLVAYILRTIDGREGMEAEKTYGAWVTGQAWGG